MHFIFGRGWRTGGLSRVALLDSKSLKKMKSCDLSLWRKFSRQWVFDACAFTKNQIERKTLAHNPSQTTKNLSMGCSLICSFLTALDASRQKRWFGSSRCEQIDRFLFLLRLRGISRQALGGANDDKFMQLRRRQRTFARRCAPPRLKYFWWCRKRISSELTA